MSQAALRTGYQAYDLVPQSDRDIFIDRVLWKPSGGDPIASEALMIGFIDPPGPYASETESREFLESIKKLPQDDPQVQVAIKQAPLQ